MTLQPPPELIDQIVGIVNISPPKAIILLRKNNNNVEKAMDAFFTDPEGCFKEEDPVNTWDYSQDNIPCTSQSSTFTPNHAG